MNQQEQLKKEVLRIALQIRMVEESIMKCPCFALPQAQQFYYPVFESLLFAKAFMGDIMEQIGITKEFEKAYAIETDMVGKRANINWTAIIEEFDASQNPLEIEKHCTQVLLGFIGIKGERKGVFYDLLRVCESFFNGGVFAMKEYSIEGKLYFDGALLALKRAEFFGGNRINILNLLLEQEAQKKELVSTALLDSDSIEEKTEEPGAVTFNEGKPKMEVVRNGTKEVGDIVEEN